MSQQSEDLYTKITGHQIVEAINADIHMLSSEIKGMTYDSPGNTFSKNTSLIKDHKNFVKSVEKNGLDTEYTIKDYNTWSHLAKITYPMHLRLDRGINEPLIAMHQRERLPKINPDFPLFDQQWRIVQFLEHAELPDLAQSTLAHYTNKLPLPIVYADKMCSTQGYGNHYAIMGKFHQANSQAVQHETWMKNSNHAELKTVNSIKQDKTEFINTEVDKFIKFMHDNNKDLANIKELKPKLKELDQVIKTLKAPQIRER